MKSMYGNQAQTQKAAKRGAVVGRSFTISKQPPKKEATHTVPITEWVMDRDQSSFEFSALYMRVVNVGGRFNEFEVKAKAAKNDFSDMSVAFTVRADSIDTGNALRDKEIMGHNWLDAVKWPVISFNSTEIKKVEEKKYEMTGNLTLHGISHTITFYVWFNGMFTNTYPQKTFAGFTIAGFIDRRKYDLGGNDVGSGVGYEIAFGANIELVKV